MEFEYLPADGKRIVKLLKNISEPMSIEALTPIDGDVLDTFSTLNYLSEQLYVRLYGGASGKVREYKFGLTEWALDMMGDPKPWKGDVVVSIEVKVPGVEVMAKTWSEAEDELRKKAKELYDSVTVTVVGETRHEVESYYLVHDNTVLPAQEYDEENS